MGNSDRPGEANKNDTFIVEIKKSRKPSTGRPGDRDRQELDKAKSEAVKEDAKESSVFRAWAMPDEID